MAGPFNSVIVVPAEKGWGAGVGRREEESENERVLTFPSVWRAHAHGGQNIKLFGSLLFLEATKGKIRPLASRGFAPSYELATARMWAC